MDKHHAVCILIQIRSLRSSPSIISRFSRLVCDANRAVDDPTFIRREIQGHPLSFNQGLDEAEDLIRRCLEAREGSLGPEHPVTLSSLLSMANLHMARGRYAEAEDLYKRGVAGRKQILGPTHGQTIRATTNLATLYMKMGRWDEAEALVEPLVEVSTRELGADDMNTLDATERLGIIYKNGAPQ